MNRISRCRNGHARATHLDAGCSQQQITRSHNLKAWGVWLYVMALGLTGIGVNTATVSASPFGYSVNINFGPNPGPQFEVAGINDDRTWNNFREQSSLGDPRRLLVDIYQDQQVSVATVDWESPAFGFGEIREGRPGDIQLMESYLESPAQIRLQQLDQVIPDAEDFKYDLIIYTHGGMEGAPGRYRVNGREQERIDNRLFEGQFQEGFRGNYLVFEDLFDPEVVIETEGFGPVNAISLVYCRTGDFNGDGRVDVQDLEDINRNVKDGTSDRKYDVNLDLTVDWSDVTSWIKCSKGTCIGDVNLDGVFDSSDLIQLFREGIYENGDKATWTTGDWNGDCVFDSSDLLLAFQEGCYDSGAAPVETVLTQTMSTHGGSVLASSLEVPSVPEPLGVWPLGCAAMMLVRHLRRRS